MGGFGSKLWAGWPMAFLTFDEESVLERTQLDSKFVAVRSFVVAAHWETITRPSEKKTRMQSEGELQCNYHADLYTDGQIDKYIDEYEMAKSGRFHEKCFVQKHRVQRVPWRTAPGTRASCSAKFARRLPRS